MILHGGGGYGKTTLALMIAQIAARDGKTVWWVSAVSEQSLSLGMREIALRLGADPSEVARAWTGQASATDLVWRMIEECVEPWLLVIDNADDSKYLTVEGEPVNHGTGWLRMSMVARGSVLITSRDGRKSAWGSKAYRCSVPRLSPNDGANVLMELAGSSAGDRTEAMRLAEALGGLPLALQLAGSYLGNCADVPSIPGLGQPRSFASYLGALGNNFVETVDARSPGELVERSDREVIARTWELSLDLLARRGRPRARILMRLLSLLAPTVIPYDFLDAATLSGSDLFGEIDSEGVLDLILSLKNFGLIETFVTKDSEGSSGILLHPLVRHANRYNVDSLADRSKYLEVASSMVGAATKLVHPDDPGSVSQWQALVPHCATAISMWNSCEGLSSMRGLAGAAAAAVRAGHFLYRSGRYREALELLRSVLALLQRESPASTDSTVLACRFNIARSLRGRGDYELAYQEFQDLLLIQRSINGPEHPDTLTTRNQLAFVIRANGFPGVAEDEFRKVLEIQERVLGGSHPETLLTKHNLGLALLEQGNLTEAYVIFLDTYQSRRRTLGDGHVHTLYSRYNIARVMKRQGAIELAEKELRDILVVQQRSLGRQHPDCLQTRTELGEVLFRLGHAADAERELEDVLQLCRSTLGQTHPYTERVKLIMQSARSR